MVPSYGNILSERSYFQQARSKMVPPYGNILSEPRLPEPFRGFAFKQVYITSSC